MYWTLPGTGCTAREKKRMCICVYVYTYVCVSTCVHTCVYSCSVTNHYSHSFFTQVHCILVLAARRWQGCASAGPLLFFILEAECTPPCVVPPSTFRVSCSSVVSSGLPCLHFCLSHCLLHAAPPCLVRLWSHQLARLFRTFSSPKILTLTVHGPLSWVLLRVLSALS